MRCCRWHMRQPSCLLPRRLKRCCEASSWSPAVIGVSNVGGLLVPAFPLSVVEELGARLGLIN